MGKITKVEVQKYNKERYSIFLDHEYAFSVSEDVLIKYNLLKGSDLDKEFIETILISEEKSKSISIALKYLSRMRTKQEVEFKLKEKGYSDYIDDTIDYLEKNGYLNDREYSIFFTRDRMNLKKMGSKRIRIELLQKGIDKKIVEEVLIEEIDKENEIEKLEELAKKLIEGKYKKDDKESKWRKTYGALMRKGYSSEMIIKILKKVL